MAKSRAQQAAIAIAKMKKEELTELIREALREVKEGNAFVDAARKAKEAGEEEFEFDGKVHKVQEVEASLAEEADTEIKVGNYQTKHYHICPGAKTLYQDIEDKVEDMDLAERTAKLQDALFAIEMRALEDGAVQADLDAAEIIADQIMAMAQMMGLEKEHHYIQGHIDKIKGAVENIDEEKAFVKNKKGDEALVDVDPADSSVKNDPNITSIVTTSGRKIKELTSVGHVDDEPGMLKQFAFDTAQYAAKLYKLLHHYEQMEDHVDFPNWWQHKVMMAREYMSKATHYLEFETMKPQIDAAVDGHSEEELAEDYVPRTKEDLVFQYLRDAWQFGAMKGKDVNPDEELSTMADSLLANLPDYDAAERVDEQAESLQSIKQKIEEKLRALGLQTKVFEDEFEVPKNARDMIAKNNKLGALAYSRDKSIFAGHPEYERLEVIIHKDHLEDLKKIANEFKMPSGSVQAFAGTDFVRLRHTADVVDESVELDEIKKAEFEKIKPGKELQLRGYGVVKVIENDGIVMKIKDSLDKVHTINLGQYNEKFLKEDDEIDDSKFSKKDAAKEKGFVAQSAADQAKAARKRKLAPVLDALEKSGVISRVDGKLKINDMDAYKKAIAAINEVLLEGVSCCGRCGRVHESAQDCKKPYISKDSPRHCKNKK